MVAAQITWLTGLFLAALAAWGAPARPVIWHDAPPSTANEYMSTVIGNPAVLTGVVGFETARCEIWVRPNFWAQHFGDDVAGRLIEHEVGHCLGFQHPNPPDPDSVMSYWPLGVTEHDRELFRQQQHRRLVVPLVAKP